MDQYLERIRALSPLKQRLLAQTVHEWLESRGSDSHGTKTLTAYYAAREPLRPDEVREYLRARLPDHFLPSEYIALDELPKTVNGKIDRSALPHFRPVPTKETAPLSSAPATANEQRMAAIWSRILSVPAVCRDNNFFAIGGHSLLATQVIMEIEQQFGINIPLGALFTYPTVAQLCAYLDAQQPAPYSSDSAEAIPREGAPLSSAQRRLWYASQLGDSLQYKIVKVLDFQGNLNVVAAVQALSEIIRRHETMRTCFGYASSTLVQQIEPSGPASVEYVDLTAIPGDSVQHACCVITTDVLRRPFDLEAGPLVRTTLVQLGPHQARMIFDAHHIILDGASFGILVQELNHLFQRFSNGIPGDLPELAAQYRDFAIWEKHHIEEGVCERQLSYWRRKLADLPRLEFKEPRLGPQPVSADGEIEFPFDPEVSVRIAGVCAQMRITPFILFASVYYLLLQMHSGARDIAMGADVANREMKKYAGLIGFFVNQVVLRVNAAASASFLDVCQLMRTSVEEAFANKDLPFETVVRELAPRTAKRPQESFFRAMFSFHHQLPDIAIEGITTKFVDVRPPASKYDLLLNIEDGNNGLSGSIEYRGTVFDAIAVNQMIAHFKALCARVVQDVDVPVNTLAAAVIAECRANARSELEQSRAGRQQDLRRMLTISAR